MFLRLAVACRRFLKIVEILELYVLFRDFNYRISVDFKYNSYKFYV
jgi:hypothetical protein